jgi:hypothetical protein
MGSAFGYLEDKVYCQIQGEQLTLYVKKEAEIEKCSTSIAVLDQLARTKYDEVLLVLDYINQGENTRYWKEVFEIQKQEFLKILNYKSKIQKAITSFEEKFFLKYQDALYQELSPYLTTLKEREGKLQSVLQQKEHPELRKKYEQISQQIITLERIFSGSSLDEIIEQIPSYLYLKEQIA